jgi:hypothetical protein
VLAFFQVTNGLLKAFGDIHRVGGGTQAPGKGHGEKEQAPLQKSASVHPAIVATTG